MKILVPVKTVGVLDEDFELSESGRDVDPDYLDYELNEWDNYAWEEALRLQEENVDSVEIIPISIGPEEVEDGLRQCLAKGGERAIRVWDDAMSGSDPMVIAFVIAKVAEREEVDMIFTGALSSDHGFAQTGVSVAAQLAWPQVAVVSKIECQPGTTKARVRRELEGGLEEVLDVQCPAVFTIQLGINEPRYASLRGIKQARAKPLQELSHRDLGLTDEQVGEAGSLSRVRRLYIPEKGQAELIEGTPPEQAAHIAKIIKQLKGEE